MFDKVFIHSFFNDSTVEAVHKPFRFELAMTCQIAENPQLLALADENDIPDIISLEVAVPRIGRVDLLARYDNHNGGYIYAFVEAKKGTVDRKALAQLRRYMNAKSSVFQNLGIVPSQTTSVIGVLVGADFEPAVIDAIHSSTGLYGVCYRRLSLAGECRHVTDVIYPQINSQQRNYARYTLIDLQGRKMSSLSKAALVRAIIDSYIGAYNPTVSDLQKAFPDSLRGTSLHFVATPATVAAERNRERYFPRTFSCADGQAMVSNQWGILNIPALIESARLKGMIIV